MKKALGKGLSALIPDSYVDKQSESNKTKSGDAAASAGKPASPKPGDRRTTAPSPEREKGAFRMIPISQVAPNQDQPRTEFLPEAIEELAASIKEQGILQPVIVAQTKEDQYTLICGERRFRAATLCGLAEIPAVVKETASEKFLEWALIENVQREDLNAIEEAEAYEKLAERGLTHEEIAKKMGKDRSTIANTLRLLRLPNDVRLLLGSGLLTSGHARCLLGLLTPEHQRQMAKRIVEENLSVRQVEALVGKARPKRKAKRARNLSTEIMDLEKRLEEHFVTQVKIFPRKNQKQGRLEIQYFSLDDLDRILEKAGLPQG